MNESPKPSARPSAATAPSAPRSQTARSQSPQVAAPAPARKRTSSIGTNALITVASLLATTSGWAWISHTEQQDAGVMDTFIDPEPAVAAPIAFHLEPIPTVMPLASIVRVQLPLAQPAARADVQSAAHRPQLRHVDPASAAALVPAAVPAAMNTSQTQAAVVQQAQAAPAPQPPAQVAPAPQPPAQVAPAPQPPAQVAPAPQPPAPITRTHSSRRRTR